MIHLLGLFLAGGFLVATFLVWRQARLSGLSEEKILDTWFASTLLALLAGRLFYVLTFWPIFAADYSRIVLFFKYPGLSVPVSLVTFVATMALFARNFSLEAWWVADVFAFAAAFFAVFANLGCFFDGCILLWPKMSLVLSGLATFLVIAFLFLSRKFTTDVKFAELAKKRGLFFLCYLIFQTVSLLMTTWLTKNWWREAFYLVVLVATVATLVVRYRQLFRQLYHAISWRRPGPNQVLSGSQK